MNSLSKLLGLLGVMALTGCATGNAEDDAFFNRGWLWPKKLDEPSKPPHVTHDSSLIHEDDPDADAAAARQESR
jgi:hypothetical protein